MEVIKHLPKRRAESGCDLQFSVFKSRTAARSCKGCHLQAFCHCKREK